MNHKDLRVGMRVRIKADDSRGNAIYVNGIPDGTVGIIKAIETWCNETRIFELVDDKGNKLNPLWAVHAEHVTDVGEVPVSVTLAPLNQQATARPCSCPLNVDHKRGIHKSLMTHGCLCGAVKRMV